VHVTRESGALSDLPIALNSRAYVHLFAGELTAARALVDESELICETTGTDQASYAALALAAFRGDEEQARALIERSTREVIPRGEGIGLTVIQWASALLFNGLLRDEEALAAAVRATEDPRELAAGNWGLPELVEAAVRTQDLSLARDAVERLAQMTQACATPWALGVEARSRALVSEPEQADSLHRQAIQHLAATGVRVDLARAYLLHGEFLRREERTAAAREQLRTAHHLFTTMGLSAFAERSRAALLACGEQVSSAPRAAATGLTAQETRIARLAGAGLTNPEIGAQLFISPHTVDWHLRKVYTKLGISSRRHIVDSMLGEGGPEHLD
jgi:DNA-binding CsgD family transcriptional regulator